MRQFGPNGETVRTRSPDTSVLGPGHFGTSAEVFCTVPTWEHCRYSALITDFMQRTHRKQHRCLRCLRCVNCAKFNVVNRSISYFAALQNLLKIKVGYLLIRLLTDNSQKRLRELR